MVQPDAVQIGELYRKARQSIVDSVYYTLECGRKLRVKKIAIGHGNWLNWLETNRDILGFEEDAAERMMRLATKLPYSALARNMTEAEALAISRQTWGHEAKAEQLEQARERRAQRERDLGGKICALPDKQYGVIYADPEWEFETYSEAGKLMSNPDNHYSTSSLTDIMARADGIEDIAANDCVLFLWSTVPRLEGAMNVINHWGFEYKSAICWIKDKWANGYWCRGLWEPLLIATRGAVVAPAPGQQMPSVVYAPRGRHSEKPDQFADLIMQQFPNVPKIELNARKRRDGWDSWGLEVPNDEQQTSQIHQNSI